MDRDGTFNLLDVHSVSVGLWIFISPFVLGYRGMMKTDAHSMIVGAIVVLVALGVAFFHKSVCGYESMEEKKIT